MCKKAIILGSGAAALAIAERLLEDTEVQPILLEPEEGVGGLQEKRSLFHRMIRFLSRLWAQLFLRRQRDNGISGDTIIHSINARGGQVLHHQCIYSIYAVRDAICSVHVRDASTGELSLFTGDLFYTTLPAGTLVKTLQAPVPPEPGHPGRPRPRALRHYLHGFHNLYVIKP
jgi:hypothetical protein